MPALDAGIFVIDIITDPKDERATKFYKEFGFQPLTGGQMFLPMTEIIQLLARNRM
jgi:hypothetical protein